MSAKGVARLSGSLSAAVRMAILGSHEADWAGAGPPPTHSLLLSQKDLSAAPTQQYGPSLDLCRLETAVSASGNRYLRGWLGGARIVVVRDGDSPAEAPAYFLRLTEMTKRAAPPPRLAINAAPEQSRLPLPLPSGAAQATMRARYADRPKPEMAATMSMADLPRDEILF